MIKLSAFLLEGGSFPVGSFPVRIDEVSLRAGAYKGFSKGIGEEWASSGKNSVSSEQLAALGVQGRSPRIFFC